VDNPRELVIAQEELIRRERLAALGEMSAVVVHEVRNPVAVIFNAAAALRKNPQEREKLLAIVEEEAGRLKRMVSDLLDFARPASLHLVEEPLAPIIESALESIEGSAGDGWLHLAVVDDGEGISPVNAALIFRPFFTTRAVGTGLGLTVVQRIVEAHGGKIAHRETPGGGATFEIRFARQPLEDGARRRSVVFSPRGAERDEEERE